MNINQFNENAYNNLILTNNVEGEIYIPNEIRDKPFPKEKAKT
jgi:hypothetical protein